MIPEGVASSLLQENECASQNKTSVCAYILLCERKVDSSKVTLALCQTHIHAIVKNFVEI